MRVISLRLHAYLILVLGGVTFPATFALGQIVLDARLSTQPVQVLKAKAPLAPGQGDRVIEGSIVAPGGPIAPLPLEVTIWDLNPASASLEDQLTVRVLIRNIGKVPLEIPCSRDSVSAFKQGNKDQRALSLYGGFTSGVDLFVLVGGASFFGSPSEPGSMCSLAPQGTALILAELRVAGGNYQLQDGSLLNKTVDIRMYVREDKYAGEAKMTGVIGESISVNSVPVFWH